MDSTTQTDRALIENYISNKAGMIINLIIDGLKAMDLEVHRGMILPNHLVNVRRGEIQGFVDVSRTLYEIASENGEGIKFDRRLNNSAYEMLKITTILQLRIRVIAAAFENQTEQEKFEKLMQMSRHVENLTIQWVRS